MKNLTQETQEQLIKLFTDSDDWYNDGNVKQLDLDTSSILVTFSASNFTYESQSDNDNPPETISNVDICIYNIEEYDESGEVIETYNTVQFEKLLRKSINN